MTNKLRVTSSWAARANFILNCLQGDHIRHASLWLGKNSEYLFIVMNLRPFVKLRVTVLKVKLC